MSHVQIFLISVAFLLSACTVSDDKGTGVDGCLRVTYASVAPKENEPYTTLSILDINTYNYHSSVVFYVDDDNNDSLLLYPEEYSQYQKINIPLSALDKPLPINNIATNKPFSFSVITEGIKKGGFFKKETPLFCDNNALTFQFLPKQGHHYLLKIGVAENQCIVDLNMVDQENAQLIPVEIGKSDGKLYEKSN